MSSLQITENQHWRETQLAYDGANWSYSKYTNAVIRKGHSLVAQLCEQTAKDIGYQPTILDIGCGWTDLYEKLHHVVGTYIGVEPATVQLIRAESRPNQYLIRGVGEKVILRDSCVDIVLHIADLDHCFDAEKAISETFRVLKPGGKTIILLENRGRFSNDIRRLLKMEISHGEEHLYYFDVDDIRSLVEPYGKIDFLQSYGFLLGFNALGKFLPEKIIEGLRSVSDGLLGIPFPKKGQHFIISVTKGNRGVSDSLGFLCPNCGTSFEWKEKQCVKCHRELKWMREDILDILGEETPQVHST